MTIVVLSPHRDDAAFSLGLAVDVWLAQGHTVSVLNCFTQSAYAPYSDIEALHPNDRVSFASAVRRREDLAWNKLVGNRLTFHDLDLLDAPLRLGCSADEVLTVEIRAGDRALARVEGAVAKLARKSHENQVLLAAPLALGGHIDHRVVHQAVLQSLATTPMPVAFYEDLPYAAREGAADPVERLAAEITPTKPDLQPVFLQNAAGTEGDAMHRKIRIAECYDSQVDSDVVRSMAEFAGRYGGRERLWANAAWREAGLPRSGETNA